MNRSELERRLSALSGFADPDPDREQYPTPPDLAAHLCSLADLQGDLDRPVLDLGSGTGILAIGAALLGARAVGVELDRTAVATARENAREAGVTDRVGWVLGDGGRPPACPGRGVTVLTNPPFGAQRGNRGADRRFLDAAAGLAAVSYSVHNGGSREFVEAFAADHGGTVTHAFAADLDVDRQFAFHTAERVTLDAEVFRIEWS